MYYGSGKLITVNFYIKFGGKGFFPESLAGFMQAIMRKSSCLYI